MTFGPTAPDSRDVIQRCFQHVQHNKPAVHASIFRDLSTYNERYQYGEENSAHVGFPPSSAATVLIPRTTKRSAPGRALEPALPRDAPYYYPVIHLRSPGSKTSLKEVAR